MGYRLRVPLKAGLCFLGLMLVGTGAQAEQPSEVRRLATDNGDPWGAVGQVNIRGYRMRTICTGTLIAPDLVLTAAHCVVDSVRKTVFRPDDIRFVAGVFRDTSRGMSPAACVRFPPGYKVDEFRGTDLALIVLKNPIVDVPPLRLDLENEAKTSSPVTHAGYPGTRRFILSIHEGCRIAANALGRVATNCEASPGSSGGPLLSMDGAPAIIGALSGLNAAGQTIFTRFSDWPDLLENGECP